MLAVSESKRDWAAVGFIVPVTLALGLLTLYPLVYSIYMSLHNWNWGNRFEFTGLANYQNLLTDGPFWNSIAVTIYFTVGAVAIELVLGLGLALLVRQMRVGSRVVRSILLIPMMVPGIVVSQIWKVMLDPTLGVLAYALRMMGLNIGGGLGDSVLAMPLIIGIDTWWQTSFVFIILYAGLQSLPTEPYEAARVDGAGGWQTFRFLTLPMLSPFILTATTFRLVDCFRIFDIVFGTTAGGPGRSTEVLQLLSYRTAFKNLQMSEAMTQMLIFSALMVISLVVFQFLTRQIGDEE